ncbi:hypothetical protein ACMU6081_29490 [Achromobacter mucicolens]
MIDLLPAQLRRPLAARVTQLHADTRIAVAVHEIHDAGKRLLLLVVPQARAPRGDAAVRRHAGHLHHHQPRPAHGARAQVNQVEIARHPVRARVHGHRRHQDPVLQPHAAHLIRRQHRNGRTPALGRGGAGAFGDPAFKSFQPGRVAQTQVLVRDALRPGQQRIGELLGFQLGVTLDVFKPFGGIARRVLDLQHLDAAHFLVVMQARLHAAFRAAQAARQLNRVFQRQLGAGADGKVRGVRRIAHQHNWHPARAARGFQIVPMDPRIADDPREADPDRRAAQVRGVADQLVAIQPGREQLFAIRNALFLAHLLDAGGLPGFLGRFHDERGHPVLVAVSVRLEPAVLGLHEGKGERVEHLFRAQPHEAAAALIDIGMERVRVAGADLTVDAVRGNDEVGIVLAGDGLIILNEVLEHKLDANILATRLQDVQELLAANADEAVTAGADAASLEMDVDVIPMVERIANGLRRDRVGLTQVLHGGVREHHAPAKSVIRTVAFDDGDFVGGILQFHEQTEIQAGGTAADADYLHCRIRSKYATVALGAGAEAADI